MTAGPTYEPIDAVRFIGNFSSGKMGYSIAEAFAEEGAEVTLISGPVSLSLDHPLIKIIPVSTAEEMFNASLEHFGKSSISVLSAAVSDYSPEVRTERKLKRNEKGMELRFIPTKDIAAALGKEKKTGQILVGFALETDDEIKNAQSKLEKKNLDLIVLNSLRDKGAGFQGDTNKVTMLDKSNNIDKFELKSKKEVAIDIVRKIISLKEK